MAAPLLDEIKKIKSGKKQLREFGVVMGIFFGVIAALLCWRHRPYLRWASFSGIFFILGLFLPQLLKPFQKAWMTVSVLIGFVMSRIILTVLFFLVLSPLALISRLFGKTYLDLSFRKPGPTYWDEAQRNREAQYYERQY